MISALFLGCMFSRKVSFHSTDEIKSLIAVYPEKIQYEVKFIIFTNSDWQIN